MRVALISGLPLRAEAEIGSAYYTRALAQALRAAGYDVEVWTKAVPAELAPCDAPVIRTWRPGFMSPFDLLRTYWKRKPDVVHLQHAMFLFGSGAAGEIAMLLFLAMCILCRVPLVTTCHDIPTLSQITPEYVSLHKYKYPASFVRLGLRVLFWLIGRASRIVIVHQDAFVDTLARDFGMRPSRIRTVPHLAIPYRITDQVSSRLELGLPLDRRLLLFFGFASGYKGIDELLDAMAELRNTFPDAMLLLGAGEHPKVAKLPEYKTYYADLRNRAHSMENVSFVGFIPDEQIDAYIDACELAVFPYVEFQGMSGPLNQCASHQLPFIVSDRIAEKIPALAAVATPSKGPIVAAAIQRFFCDNPYRRMVEATCAEFARGVVSDDYLVRTKLVYAAVSGIAP